MNNVDQADQLRKVYCFNRWMRNKKWWWAIFLWALSVMLVNAYVAYIASNVLIWKRKKKDLLTHYEFRKKIALALVNPTVYGINSTEGDVIQVDDDTVTHNTASLSHASKKQKDNKGAATRAQVQQLK